MVSVIVPIYNVERYLSQCLNSVLNQTYRDLEIILVNDASPDGSLAVCERFAARDPRIKIIDKKVNEGVDLARFAGLDAAQGEYVYFIDPDDWLARRDIIELMVNKADETGVDYVLINYQRIFGRHGLYKQRNTLPTQGLVSDPNTLRDFYLGFYGWSRISLNVWDKLYRKNFLDNANISPSKMRFGQDVAFNFRLFPNVKSIYLLDVYGYNYRYGGLTTKNSQKHLNTRKGLFRLMMTESTRNDFPDGRRQAVANFMAILESEVITIGSQNKREKSIELIKNELNDDFYDELFSFAKIYPDLFSTHFAKLMMAKDANSLINRYQQDIKLRKRRIMARNLINSLLKCI